MSKFQLNNKGLVDLTSERVAEIGKYKNVYMIKTWIILSLLIYNLRLNIKMRVVKFSFES
ncbi:hypothetical protein RBU49_12940 [Clostridium sp. MB40-C1]|uniref:hypothetical protein n=1 Tax=Clostridium sp. MB40-C1 TaxID=3070996 RepID=UPI0027E1C625|nr:hypothetical protein [Clostridium sp. MB40-C1]WMJ79766.1 hypothetical protein RBU49_12940 [Clostridium sp. MB40-C1]